MEREACVCDHGFERSDLCAEIITIIIIIGNPASISYGVSVPTVYVPLFKTFRKNSGVDARNYKLPTTTMCLIHLGQSRLYTSTFHSHNYIIIIFGMDLLLCCFCFFL